MKKLCFLILFCPGLLLGAAAKATLPVLALVLTLQDKAAKGDESAKIAVQEFLKSVENTRHKITDADSIKLLDDLVVQDSAKKYARVAVQVRDAWNEEEKKQKSQAYAAHRRSRSTVVAKTEEQAQKKKDCSVQ